MIRAVVLVAATVAAGIALRLSVRPPGPVGTYRPPAGAETLAGWERDWRAKRDAVPAPPPPASGAPGPFSGTWRFGRYDYPLVIEQRGDRVVFRSGGVDRQDIGGAWETVGEGVVVDGRVRARWWCFDLTRHFANNGGCTMELVDGDPDRLAVVYYHDSDRRIEEGWGVRAGTHEGERLEYRVRVPHPVESVPGGVVLSGTVRGRGGEPVPDAVVMVRGDEFTATRTGADGRWSIRVTELPTVLLLSAGARGYRNAAQAILRQELRPVDFVLEPSPWTDDPAYEFVAPDPERATDLWRCGNCHRNSYDEWKDSRHARAADGAVVQAVYARDFLPALARGEASGDAGLCAACHAPSAAVDDPDVRLDAVAGVHARGNHCDFCHKVHHVEELDRPGVRGSLRLGRPSPGQAGVPGPIGRVYGPLADSDYLFMGPVHNALFTTSALCAGCHQYTTDAGIPALATYDEWRAWAAARDDPRTCQSCHMPAGGSRERGAHARRIAVNALRRPPEQIHPHDFRGRERAKDAVSLAVEAVREGDAVVVRTTVAAADDAGHRVPTGSADKHLLLALCVTGRDGAARPLRDGPRVPEHAGGAPGAPAAPDALERRWREGDWAGWPGTAFAQVLVDAEGRRPVPFWRAVAVVEDTRLRPGESVEVRHRFDAPDPGPVRVRVELRHRLRFKAHDVAHDARGPGVRPLDEVLAAREIEVER